MVTDVPEAVQRRAQERNLGDPVDERRETSAAAMVGAGVGVSALGVVISLVVARINAGHPTHLILPTGVLVLGGLALALRGLLVGTRVHYLFAGGLVSRRRTGLRTLTWPEVTVVETVHRRETGAVAGYRLRGAGTWIAVPLKVVAGRDAFVDRVLDQVRAHGVTVR